MALSAARLQELYDIYTAKGQTSIAASIGRELQRARAAENAAAAQRQELVTKYGSYQPTAPVRSGVTIGEFKYIPPAVVEEPVLTQRDIYQGYNYEGAGEGDISGLYEGRYRSPYDYEGATLGGDVEGVYPRYYQSYVSPYDYEGATFGDDLGGIYPRFYQAFPSEYDNNGERESHFRR